MLPCTIMILIAIMMHGCIALFQDVVCDNASPYRFVLMITIAQDTEYITALFQLVGWVLLACVIMTGLCILIIQLSPRTTLLTDPSIPEYTPDQLYVYHTHTYIRLNVEAHCL